MRAQCSAAPTTLPLAAVFATAQPGCTPHVMPDVVGLATTSNGTASDQFVLPNTPSLAGVTFHHQMVPLALDATLAVTATNSLHITIVSAPLRTSSRSLSAGRARGRRGVRHRF